MSVIFHPLRVRAIEPDTQEAVIVSFDVPQELREVFGFTQGQYLTLRTQIEGQDLRRSYSICAGVCAQAACCATVATVSSAVTAMIVDRREIFIAVSVCRCIDHNLFRDDRTVNRAQLVSRGRRLQRLKERYCQSCSRAAMSIGSVKERCWLVSG